MTGRPIACLAPLLLSLLAPPALADDLPGEAFKNHLILALGFGDGTVSMGQDQAYVGAFNRQLKSQGWAVQGQANPASELHAALSLTYYGPYWTLVRVGAEVAFFQPTEQGTPLGGSLNVITNYGGTVEIPVLFGGHYAFADNRLILEAAVGPDFTVVTMTGLDSTDLANNPRLVGDTAVGVDSEFGLRYLVSPLFSVGFELGYRSLVTPPLHASDGTTPYIGPGGSTTNLDFSGFRGVVDLALVVL